MHSTAFSGSMYSICTLAAWGLTFSQLPDGCSLVMEKASIEYFRPVNGAITTIDQSTVESKRKKSREIYGVFTCNTEKSTLNI